MNTQQQLPEQSFFLAFQSMVKQAVSEALKEQVAPVVQPASEVRPPATRRQGAEFISVSLPTLDTLIKTGQIKAFRVGRGVRIHWDELERYVNEAGEYFE